MSRGVNKWIGIGNACADPDSRFMPNGDQVVNLTIACNDSYKDKSGQTVDKTEFVRLVFFKGLAKIVADYVHKGSKIYVEGRNQTRSWEKDGQKHYTTEIVCNEMQMLDSKDSAAQSHSASPPGAAPVAGRQHKSAQTFDDFDSDEIPFN